MMHTPGPWKEISFGGTLETYYCYIANPEGKYVAAVVKRVDARLITAAPDLLAALLEMVQDKEDGPFFHEDEHGEGSTLRNARTAIAKARGE